MTYVYKLLSSLTLVDTPLLLLYLRNGETLRASLNSKLVVTYIKVAHLFGN